MPVLVGMGIPKNAPNPEGGKALMRHLVKLGPQAALLSLTGFFPVVGGRLSKQISPGLRAEAGAVARQQKAKDAVQALLPIGIGAEEGTSESTTATRSPASCATARTSRRSLGEQGELLDQIFAKTNAPCWAPDPPSGKARCRVA